jgi:hypothetical protein
MPTNQGRPSPFVDPRVKTKELGNLGHVLANPFSQSTINDWVGASSDRQKVAEDMYFGTIRWPKSVGRSTAPTLSQGFNLVCVARQTISSHVAGGADRLDHLFVTLAPPLVWDVADDDEHFRVNYAGYGMRTHDIDDYNNLQVYIAGSWTGPVRVTGRFRLPDPLGHYFYDLGSPVALSETTVREHRLHPDF